MTERRLTVGARALRAYFALGIVLVYAAEGRTLVWAFAGIAAGIVLYWLLSLAMKGGEAEALSPSCGRDSLGWSAATTTGVSTFLVTTGLGSPIALFAPLQFLDLMAAVAYLFFLGAVAGVATYFRCCLIPLSSWRDATLEVEALRLEHQECQAMLRSLAGVMATVFAGAFAAYAIDALKPGTQSAPSASQLVRHSAMVVYLLCEYIVWLLRPFHGRTREIRARLHSIAAGRTQKVAAEQGGLDLPRREAVRSGKESRGPREGTGARAAKKRRR